MTVNGIEQPGQSAFLRLYLAFIKEPKGAKLEQEDSMAHGTRASAVLYEHCR